MQLSTADCHSGHMLCSLKNNTESVASGPVAIVGSDDWLRGVIMSRLISSDLKVRNYGPGTSSLRPADTLVLVPRLVPTSFDPARSVGLAANAMTLAAALNARINNVVLVSLIGADPRMPGHLGALGRLESRARSWAPRLTVVRASQVYGSMGNPGPLVDRMRSTLRRHPVRLGDLPCRPVFIAELLDVVEAAVRKELAEGAIDVTGETALHAGEFIEEFDERAEGQNAASASSHRWPSLPSVRRADQALCELLEAQSGIIDGDSERLPRIESAARPDLRRRTRERPKVA